MSKQVKIWIVVALLVGGAIAVYFLWKKNKSGGATGAVKPPTDKSSRNFVPKPGKDARYAPSDTGKAAPFANLPAKPDKDSRFDAGITGKIARFV